MEKRSQNLNLSRIYMPESHKHTPFHESILSLCFGKRRGSLFKKVSRPSRSQKAQRSRGSIIAEPGKAPPKLNKSRGSAVNLLDGDKKPNNFNANNINQWSDDDINKEQREMMAQIAALAMKNTDVI